MKSRCKSRFLCFRPVCVDDADVRNIKPAGQRKSSARGPVFTYISVSTTGIDMSRDDGQKGSTAVEIPKKQSDQKVGSEKLQKDPIPDPIATENNVAERKLAPQSRRKSPGGDDRKIQAATARSSSFLSSSGRKNPVVSDSDLWRARRGAEKGSGNYSSAAGLYWLVISLSVLVMWGRLCAILWTSTCLYFALRRRSDSCRSGRVELSPAIVKKSPEIDGSEYRKRVIMEGLLERNPNHHRV